MTVSGDLFVARAVSGLPSTSTAGSPKPAAPPTISGGSWPSRDTDPAGSTGLTARAVASRFGQVATKPLGAVGGNSACGSPQTSISLSDMKALRDDESSTPHQPADGLAT